MNFIRTNSENQDFIFLVHLLDADLALRDGNEHHFYAQFNRIDSLKNVIVVYENEKPIACGAFKELEPDKVEIKRMFTIPTQRGKGIATNILIALENWAKELSYNYCVLETGKRQVEALQLYQKNAYSIIPNYGQYQGIDNSICFQKKIV